MSTKPTAAEKPVKIKTILISQARPTDENSPYFTLAKKYNLKIDFRLFIGIEHVPFREFRKQKISIMEYTAIVLTSKNAVDAFFNICKEAKLEMPPEMKYFCVTEQTANYLQKYIQVRKRKVFTGNKTVTDLFEYFNKQKTEKYLYPCSDIRRNDVVEHLKKIGAHVQEGIMYHTVSADLTDIKPDQYDVIAFFSPSGVESLLKSFPGYEQGHTRLAALGPTTAQAIKEAGLQLDIEAPKPNAPSMALAIEVYMKELGMK